MPFAETERVIYRKNPLDRVICQLRFPSILRIDAESPVIFQERMRGNFPILKETTEVTLSVAQPAGIEDHSLPKVVSESPQASTRMNYEFGAEDGASKINLTKTFLALSDNNYQRWEKFIASLEEPFQTLIDIYSPVHFSRIGLRYVDVIKKADLGLSEVPWKELLHPHVAGTLSSEIVSEDIIHLESRTDIKLSDGKSVVRIGVRLSEDRETQESNVTIDSDFFLGEMVAISEVMNQLDYFHERASRLFRWAITERLHEAMEPQST